MNSASILSLFTLAVGGSATMIKLSEYKISDVTVSGLSAGGYMAVQMHISHSSIINGSAIFAGGPFYCAQGNLGFAETKCMDVIGTGPNVNELISLTNSDEKKGFIDQVKNLEDDRVYMFSGKSDSVVDPDVVQSLFEYYEAFIPTDNIIRDFNIDAEHCIPTLDYGEKCTRLGSPYIGDCGYDGAGRGLNQLYTGLNPRGKANSKNFFTFDQTPYFKDQYASIGDMGYIYIPSSCQDKETICHLHLSFHGCEQTVADIGSQYAEFAGFNEWAETNNIIVLYPYAKRSYSFPSNPNGCFDWWGYTDSTYYGVQKGVQVTFARDLITAVSGL